MERNGVFVVCAIEMLKVVITDMAKDAASILVLSISQAVWR